MEQSGGRSKGEKENKREQRECNTGWDGQETSGNNNLQY